MPQFSAKSKERLATCHILLQQVCNEVIKHYDCTVVCGHRNKEDQEEAVRTGKSKVHFPNSKHNPEPSEAVDLVPCPVDWNNKEAFYHFAGFVRGVAAMMNVKVRWGGDWDGDFDLKDQNFFDLPHFELSLPDEKQSGE